MGRLPAVTAVRVIVGARSDPATANDRMVDKDDEACYSLHKSSDPRTGAAALLCREGDPYGCTDGQSPPWLISLSGSVPYTTDLSMFYVLRRRRLRATEYRND